MITKAYIQQYGFDKMEPEHREVLQVLQSRGVSCETFTMKKLDRNQLLLDQETLVVGDHDVMKRVFKRLNYSCRTDTYPHVLRPYLKRSLRSTSVRSFLSYIENGSFQPVFVKPKEDSKLFNGCRITSERDIVALTNVPGKTEIYISDVVDWQSEYRVFVMDNTIVGAEHYSGDVNLTVDLEVVQQAVEEFKNASQCTKGYSLDFGVLENGETALVEWNDGYSLGSYGLDKEVYTDLLVRRWEEITEKVF